MAKAGKIWSVKYPASGEREFFRYYYSGNTRTLQHQVRSGDWRVAPGVIYAGKAVKQRKVRGKWKGSFSKSEKATIRHIRRKHGF